MNVGMVEGETGWTQAKKQGSKEWGKCWRGVTRRRAVRGETDEEAEQGP